MASIKKTKSGTWRVHFRDSTGRSQTKTFRLRADADDFRVEIEHDRLTGSGLDRSLARMTVHDFAVQWYQSLTVKPKTRDGYREKYNLWVMPQFGVTPVSKIDRADVQAWAMGITDNHGLSQSTRDQAVNALRGVLQLAVDRRAIKVNPAMNLGLPKLPTQHEMTFLTMDEVRQLAIEAGRLQEGSDINQLIIELVAFTGLRAGELWALRWMDVDPHNSEIVVRRSVTTLSDSSMVIGLPKNSKGRRIPVPDWLMDKLITQRIQVTPLDTVFPDSKGGIRRHSNFTSQVFKPAAALIGHPKMRFHDLRHTYAALMIAEGADAKIVQTRMGHSTISITFDIYGHVMPEKDQGITEALGARYLDAVSVARGDGVRGASVVAIAAKG